MAGIWTEDFTVRAYEIDPRGRASVQTLCNYLQEAAGRHARALGVSVEQLLDKNLTWVLTRLHVQIDAYPELWEKVTVETWPSGQNGLYATRDFFLKAEDRIIARATSAWLVLDVARRRPIRTPAFITEIRTPDRTRALEDDLGKLPPFEEPTHELPFRVRYSDLDLNAHVNNVRYVEWAVEAVPQAIFETHRPTEIEVHFRAETNLNDTVLAQVHPHEHDLTFLHRLVRKADGREVATARSRWR